MLPVTNVNLGPGIQDSVTFTIQRKEKKSRRKGHGRSHRQDGTAPAAWKRFSKQSYDMSKGADVSTSSQDIEN